MWFSNWPIYALLFRAIQTKSSKERLKSLAFVILSLSSNTKHHSLGYQYDTCYKCHDDLHREPTIDRR